MAALADPLTFISRTFVPIFPKMTDLTRSVTMWEYYRESCKKKRLSLPLTKQSDPWILVTLVGRWKHQCSFLGQGVLAQYAKRIHFPWVFFLSSHVLLLELLSELIGIEMQSSFLITFYRSDCSVINWKTRKMWWIVQLRSLHSFWPRSVGRKLQETDWKKPFGLTWILSLSVLVRAFSPSEIYHV